MGNALQMALYASNKQGINYWIMDLGVSKTGYRIYRNTVLFSMAVKRRIWWYSTGIEDTIPILILRYPILRYQTYVSGNTIIIIFGNKFWELLTQEPILCRAVLKLKTIFWELILEPFCLDSAWGIGLNVSGWSSNEKNLVYPKLQ